MRSLLGNVSTLNLDSGTGHAILDVMGGAVIE